MNFRVHGVAYSVQLNAHLDQLIRTNDPGLRKRLEQEFQPLMGAGHQFRFELSEQELKRLARLYGEQYVAEPCQDLNEYFDVLAGRFFFPADSNRRGSTCCRLQGRLSPVDVSRNSAIHLLCARSA